MNAPASVTLAKYVHASSGDVGGYELVQGAGGDHAAAGRSLQWLAEDTEGRIPPEGFLLIRMPAGLQAEELAALLQQAQGLDQRTRLCLAWPAGHGHEPEWIDLAHAAGVLSLLDDVGFDTRLGDLGRAGYDAVRLLPEFVEQAAGCPRTAACVDAAIGLAHGLGMQCLAYGLLDRTIYDHLVQAGVDYVGEEPAGRAPFADLPLGNPADVISVASTTDIQYFLA